MSGAATLNVQGLLDLSNASLAIGGDSLTLHVGPAAAAAGISLSADDPAAQLRLNDSLVSTMTELGKSGKLTLTLNGLTASAATEQTRYTYSLFNLDEDSTLSAAEQISYQSMLAAVLRSSVTDESGKRAAVTIDENGQISVALVDVGDLTWDTSRTETTWRDGGNGWQDGKAFVAEDTVTFTDADSPATLHQITISGSVAPQTMTVGSGAWKFTATTASTDDLTVAEALTVGAAEGSPSAVAEFAGAGNISAASVTVNSGGQLTISSTGTKTFTSGIEVKAGGEFIVDGTGFGYTTNDEESGKY